MLQKPTNYKLCKFETLKITGCKHTQKKTKTHQLKKRKKENDYRSQIWLTSKVSAPLSRLSFNNPK